MAVKVDMDICIGCGACVGICLVNALNMNDDGKSVCDERTCTDCGSYVSTYPVPAIFQ